MSPSLYEKYENSEIRDKLSPASVSAGTKVRKPLIYRRLMVFVPVSTRKIWGQTKMRILSPYFHFVPVCPQNRKIGDKMDPLKTPVKWGFSDCLSPPSKYGDKWKMPEMPILSGFLSFCPQICPQKKKKSGDRKIRYPMGFFPAGTNSGTNSFKPL